MKVLINPTYEQRGSGVTAVARWQHPDCQAAMNALFGLKPNEHITQLEIDAKAITVRIITTQRKPQETET